MPEGSNTYIEIPEQCRRVKDQFDTRPDGLVREVKDFIRNGGEPHLFTHHTHTKPVAGSKPVYLDEFDLPEAARKFGRLAPCPCCTPNDRKYGRNGKIAWFPEERVVRLMGPDCFAALDQEGHTAAVEELKKERMRRQNTRYLLRHHDRLLGAVAAFREALLVAQAIDSFAEDFTYKVGSLCNIPLWDYVKTGKLQVQEEFSEFTRGGETRQAARSRDYAPVRGINIVSAKRRDYAYLFNQNLVALSVLEREGWSQRIDEMTDPERDKLARFVSNTIKRSRSLMEEMRELQRFVSIENVNTIRAWGKRGDAPLRLHIERDGNNIRVGREVKVAFRVAIPTHMEDELAMIDAQTLKEVADEGE